MTLWFIACYTQKTAMINISLLNHAPVTATIFGGFKLAKVDLDMYKMDLRHTLQTTCLDN